MGMMDKISRKDAIDLLKHYLTSEITQFDWFNTVKPYIKAIIFYGSTAKGLNRVDSDLDILIILPLEIEEAYTEGEYFYRFNDREINIVIRSIERLRLLAENQNDSFEAEVFRNSEILFESDPEVSNLLGIIKRVK